MQISCQYDCSNVHYSKIIVKQTEHSLFIIRILTGTCRRETSGYLQNVVELCSGLPKTNLASGPYHQAMFTSFWDIMYLTKHVKSKFKSWYLKGMLEFNFF